MRVNYIFQKPINEQQLCTRLQSAAKERKLHFKLTYGGVRTYNKTTSKECIILNEARAGFWRSIGFEFFANPTEDETLYESIGADGVWSYHEGRMASSLITAIEKADKELAEKDQ